MTQAQEYINNNYLLEKRKEITKLDISQQELQGSLKLERFTNLTTLNCSQNQLTELDLSDCPNLVEINCWGNDLTNLKLVNLPHLQILNAWTNNLTELNWEAFNPQTLTILSLSNNDFSQQDLTSFSKFTNLEGLWIGNDIEERIEAGTINRFTGSLKPLQNLKKLKKLQIEGTNVEEDFEHLPQDLQLVYWGKETIIKQLGLDKEGEEAQKLRRTNPTNFSEILSEVITSYVKKQLGSNLTPQEVEKIKRIGNALSIRLGNKEAKKQINFLEQLMTTVVEKGEKKAFLKKLNGMNKIIDKWDEQGKEGKINKLKSLEELKRYRLLISGTQWTNRVFSVAGGVSLLYGYTEAGGWVAVVCPFIETVASRTREIFYEKRKNEWEEFTKDTENFLDSCWELKNHQFSSSSFYSKEAKLAFRDLKEKIYEFLKKYDEDGNQEIDEEEWKKVKKQFAQDLRDNWGERGDELVEIKQVVKKIKGEMNDSQEFESKEKLVLLNNQQEQMLEKEEYKQSIEIPINN